MKMKNIVGIDIGGTSIEGGRIEYGRIVSKAKSDTQASIGGERTMDILKHLIAGLVTDQTEAIGIGVPSIVDREKGIVYNVQNIAGWDEIPLKAGIEAEFGLPVHIDNDANCFAMGEKIFGKGQDCENFVGVTLGTGLGAGIIQGHRLISDANCGSGEFGEIPYMDSKLEDFCGSRFFLCRGGISRYEAAVKAREGDMRATELFKEYGRHLAYLVKIIMLVLDPQAIIFGGSIAKSFDLFSASIFSNISDFPYPKSIENIRILASDQSDSGILGAGALCMNTATTILQL